MNIKNRTIRINFENMRKSDLTCKRIISKHFLRDARKFYSSTQSKLLSEELVN